MRKGIRKAVSMLLSAALMITGMGIGVHAEEPEQGTGLCEHHPQHDETCGYVAAVEGHECNHVHTEACYIEVDPATPSEATPGNGEKQKILNCSHAVEGEHDDTCGYVEAVEGKPCTYRCEECSKIPYMDADGVMHYDHVDRERIITVSSDNYQWSNSTASEVWYYLKDNQVFDKRIEIMEGHVNLVLGRGATLTAKAGICVTDGAALTIYGQSMTDGVLRAYSLALKSAAIGGGSSEAVTGTAGDITINSGTVYAGPAEGKTGIVTTMIGSAGIGVGSGGLGSTITINGGTVTADGIGTGPGIGGGGDGGSRIIITGGTVRATGGTANTGDTVSGSVIVGGAGIGGGETSPGGTVEISGGTVTATGGRGAAGIGAGQKGNGGVDLAISGGAKVTARGDRAAVDADLSFSGVYDGDYMVIANEENAEGGVVAAFCVGEDERALSAPLTSYRYLKAAPGTLEAVVISPQNISVNMGQQISFAVMTADGTYPAADATEILKTGWGLSSGIAGYQPGGNTSLVDGRLTVGGDEKLEKLAVTAMCMLPEGVRMVQDTADVTVRQANYTVSFDANGGQTDAVSMQTSMGRLTGALPTASRTGYTFTGWYLNRPADGTTPDVSAQVDGNTVYAQDTTLYAGWRVNQYTITYYSMGGNPQTFTRTAAYGGHAPTPATPVKDLAAFQGWYTDLSYTRRWDFDRDLVTGDLQLYAKWSDAVLDVTVSADAVPSYGGTVLYAGKYRSGSLVTLEAEPAAGYRFRCWTKDGAVVSTSAKYLFTADEDIALKAEFVWVGVSGGSFGGGSGSAGGSFGGGSGSAGGGFGGGSSSAGGSGSAGDSFTESGSAAGSFGGGSGSVDTSDSAGAGSASAETEQGGPMVTPLTPTVVPGSGGAVSMVIAVADAAAANVANAQLLSGAWVQNEQGWILQIGDAVAANTWFCVAEKDGTYWYHFGNTGFMDVGWLELDGKKYYLHAIHDGTAGRMLTGWQLLDGKWYYFSSASDATLGSLLTNTVTPDGYLVNAQGEWIQ